MPLAQQPGPALRIVQQGKRDHPPEHWRRRNQMPAVAEKT